MANTVGFFRTAWLLIAQGGWWTPREVLERIPVSIDIQDGHTLLWAMANRYRFLERRGERRRPEYAVTRDCRMPKGLTIGEVVAVVSVNRPRGKATAGTAATNGGHR